MRRIWAIDAVVIILSVVLCYYAGQYYPLVSISAMLFALTIPLALHEEHEGISRLSAIYRSFLPGLGHCYLNKNRRGVPFFIVFGTSLALLILSVSNFDYFAMALLLFAVNWFAASVHAVIDVEDLCDSMGIPHDSTFEMNVKNVPLGHFALSLISGLAAIAISVWCHSSGFCPSMLILTVTMICYLAYIFGFGSLYLRNGRK